MTIETTRMIPARDGFDLAATIYQPQTTEDQPSETVVIINSAMAVPRRFYRYLATYLAQSGFTVVTYDYRGLGESRPASLRGFEATATDWALLDMAGVVDWVHTTFEPQQLIHIGHSFGGQVVGLLPNGDQIDGVITLCSQSGYWRLQGGMQKGLVAFHEYVTLPLLSQLFGYMPWSRLGASDDLPKGVALQWAKWGRHPLYLLGDDSLPLARYRQFAAPVLAYSFDDDDWGTRTAVDALMLNYPNVERRHVVPAEVGLKNIAHFGYFRPDASRLWADLVDWIVAERGTVTNEEAVSPLE